MNDLVWPLVAIRDDGTTIVAYTPEKAASFRRLRPEIRHVHHWEAIMGSHDGEAVYVDRTARAEWIVRDDAGRVVAHDELPIVEKPRGGLLRRRADEARQAAGRGLPIPRTGRRGRWRHGWRWFSHGIAGRAADAALGHDLTDWGLEDMRVGRTRAHLLPDVGDDVAWRSDRRSWKHYRHRQWR